jgi:predicted nucleic acid-binding protein
MSYWDTSTLVKLYTKEADSAGFENYLATSPNNKISTSRIALWEARATFHRKEAEGILKAGAAEILYNQLTRDTASAQIKLIEVGNNLEAEYGQVLALCYQQNPPILVRTFDAIHLACARLSGEAEIVATDKRMRAAAHLLGFLLFPV